MESIFDLPRCVDSLDERARSRFLDHYRVRLERAESVLPLPMHRWVEARFGSTESVENQRVLQVFDRKLLRSTAFNPMRAMRPGLRERPSQPDPMGVLEDPSFASPHSHTPSDLFGRIESKSSVTASNIAKVERCHGVIIFRKPNPVQFGLEDFCDHFLTARQWILESHRREPHCRFPVIGWNALPKAGASIVHGHLQTLLSPSPLPFVEQLSSLEENEPLGYLSQVFDIHMDLGLAQTFDSHRVWTTITPRKERETWILSKEWDEGFLPLLYEILRYWIDHLLIESFNLVIGLSPLDQEGPLWTCLVDRGPQHLTTDIGFVELLLHQGIVSHDPVPYWKGLEERLAHRE